MAIQPPDRNLSPSDLQHPKGKVKAWNGEMRKPRSDRFNGAPDMEDRGFTTRGITVTEGTRPPSNVRPAVGRPGMPAAPPPTNMSRALQHETPDQASEVEKPSVYERKAFDSSKTSEKPRDEKKGHWRHIFDNGGGD